VTASAQTLAAGRYQGQIVVAPVAGGTGKTVPVTFTVAPAIIPPADATHALNMTASLTGSIPVAFQSGLAPTIVLTPAGHVLLRPAEPHEDVCEERLGHRPPDRRGRGARTRLRQRDLRGEGAHPAARGGAVEGRTPRARGGTGKQTPKAKRARVAVD
jgi:hypothetical protein